MSNLSVVYFKPIENTTYDSEEKTLVKKKAIVLGGTAAHIPLINNLKTRGYFTILIDYYENPIAKEVADKHIQESTLDKEKVLEIAKQEKADLVIATSVDQANSTACFVSEKLGLHVPYSYETSLRVTDKLLMKRIMIENGIPTSKYCQIKDVKDCSTHDLSYPVIVKPSDSNGSKGVRKVNTLEELTSYAKQALMISRNGKAIIEEFKEGKEIGIDCFITDNEVKVLTARSRQKIKTSENTIQQIWGTIHPAMISEDTNKLLKQITNQIARVFNLNNTPLIVQVIVNDSEINVLELAPRIGGGESTRFIKLITGCDILNASIDSFLGFKVDVNHKVTNGYFSDVLIYAKPSVFGFISIKEQLLDEKILEYSICYKTKGMKIGEDLSSVNRVGAFVVKSSSLSDLKDKIKYVIERIEVYDIYGNPTMRKDVYF